jgi:hypothetical protein
LIISQSASATSPLHGFLAGLLEVTMAGLRQHLGAKEHAEQAVSLSLSLSLGRGMAQVHGEQLENTGRLRPAACAGCAVLQTWAMLTKRAENRRRFWRRWIGG